jgi:hypothetical protein
MGWLSSRSGDHPGPRYDPHRPWLLIGYRPGGGRPKTVYFYASQAEAAFHLRQHLREQRGYDMDDRYAYLVKHVTGRVSQWWALDMPLPLYEWQQLARAQARVAMNPSYGMKRRTRKAKRR